MLQGPVLNLGSPQGKYADGILALFEKILLPQTSYIERVKRHYKQFRATVDQPRNLLLRRRKTGGEGVGYHSNSQPACRGRVRMPFAKPFTQRPP
jgi:hypothetical protein